MNEYEFPGKTSLKIIEVIEIQALTKMYEGNILSIHLTWKGKNFIAAIFSALKRTEKPEVKRAR